MSYRVELAPAAERDIKKLPPPVRREVINVHLPRIANDPRWRGSPLHGEFVDYWSYHFGHRPEYRIIYSVEEDIVTVMIVLIGARENIYKRLRRRVG
ncbi:MAG: type II toxin-antitoxin system RelE/ParE family toxin [Acidobacteria bacterium]|nr:type II toxin-antitoxin system RelE/ParE family toxin [Acidobacteriota bacterium]